MKLQRFLSTRLSEARLTVRQVRGLTDHCAGFLHLDFICLDLADITLKVATCCRSFALNDDELDSSIDDELTRICCVHFWASSFVFSVNCWSVSFGGQNILCLLLSERLKQFKIRKKCCRREVSSNYLITSWLFFLPLLFFIFLTMFFRQQNSERRTQTLDLKL